MKKVKAELSTGVSDLVTFPSGTVIWGSFPSAELLELIQEDYSDIDFSIWDPPYGGVLKNEWDQVVSLDDFLIQCIRNLWHLQKPNSATYMFGGTGTPKNRQLYKFLSRVEEETGWTIANHITWKKRRAYGLAYNYLYTREELIYFTLGEPKNVSTFNVPLLKELRGYAGYDKAHPAKSEFLRRSNVWTDINEMFKGKIHDAQKPVSLIKIPIEVHTNKGDLVFDPFCGSGTTAIAAKELGRRFLVVDSDKASFELTVKRLGGNP